MRLLIADELDLDTFDELKLLGVEIDYEPGLSTEDLSRAASGVDILLVRSTPVTAETIESAPQVSLIVRAGVGVDTIALGAASARGIYVAHCPGKEAPAVAELVFGMALALDRQLVQTTAELRAGECNRERYADAPGIHGCRIGVAGLGTIGAEVVKRARAFSMTPQAWSRSLTPGRAARAGVGYCGSLAELAAGSDVLSIHLPLTPETQGIVNREVLEALPEGAILINTAHEELVDEQALVELAAPKKLRIGLDVAPMQPDVRARLLAHGAVVASPNIGGSTQQAWHATAQEACRIIRAFLTEEEVPNVVNVCRNTPARYALVLRMVDRVGVLANALNVVKRHGINIEECTNTVFDGAQAGCTKLRVSNRPTKACLEEIRAFEEVLYVDVLTLPNLA